MALAQGLVLPEAASVGGQVEISASGLEPGAYPIEIVGPDGVQVFTLVTTENGGVLTWKPPRAGHYRFILYTPGGRQTAELDVAPPPPKVVLEPEGLRIGDRMLPLPAADWLPPLEEPGAVYLAIQGAPLVLRVDYEGELKPSAYYPPDAVKDLGTGPVALLADGRVVSLSELGPEAGPYTGELSALEPLRLLGSYWREKGVTERLPPDPGGYRPYWVYWAMEAGALTVEDLAAWGRDLLRRGHRVELEWRGKAGAWAESWQEEARDARDLEPEQSLRLTRAMFDYAPQHPRSKAFFIEQARWLESRGRFADALRLREGVRQMSAFTPALDASMLKRAVWALAIAYLALIAVLLARYFPAQRRGLASLGGLLGSWSRNPLRRMGHLLLAYAGWGERLLTALLFLALLVSLLVWGTARSFERVMAEAPLARAAFIGSGQAIADWPQGRGRELLQAVAQGGDTAVPAVPLAFSEALHYRLNNDEEALENAYRLDAGYTPVLEHLGLGADAWTAVYRQAGVDRLGTPRGRDLAWLYLDGALRSLKDMPTMPLESLGLDRVWSWVLLVLAGLWALMHAWVLILPRPRQSFRASGVLARALELAVPGSNSLGKGWGVILLLAAAHGLVLLVEGETAAGAAWLVAAYLPHLVLWYGEVHR